MNKHESKETKSQEIFEHSTYGDRKTAKDRIKKTNKKGILNKVLNKFK